MQQIISHIDELLQKFRLNRDSFGTRIVNQVRKYIASVVRINRDQWSATFGQRAPEKNLLDTILRHAQYRVPRCETDSAKALSKPA